MRNVLMLLCLLAAPVVMAQQWNFTLHKHQSPYPGPTLLVIGGIQGDEPGGFNAASLLVTNYSVQRGELWVVPNLNFESIIKRSRGVHGDMNRKFKRIAEADPEYLAVEKIKRIIADKQVDIILNLHDGSGFYRPEYIDTLRNPLRWGQSLIIDQAQVENVRYGQMLNIATAIAGRINRHVTQPDHAYYVMNTRTSEGNKEMEKTLTYYAIQHGKSAFGVEASKEFGTAQRAYHHLSVVEAFMQYLGIEYQRNFDLAIDQVGQHIDNNVKLALYEQRMFFDMRNVRDRLNFVPMKKNAPVDYAASNPLIAVVGKEHNYQVRYGNRYITELSPQYFQYDDSLTSIDMLVDGREQRIRFGNVIDISDSFLVLPLADYRVNIIGFSRPGIHNEQGIAVRRQDILSEYSIDRAENIYRVEVYRDNRFCGMVLVNFTDNTMTRLERLHRGPDAAARSISDG